MIDITPLYDGVVVERVLETKKESGIILPQTVTENQQYVTGKVVKVGAGYLINGNIVPLQVKVNDTVLYTNYKGIEHVFKGTKYVILKEADIIGIMKNG